MLIEIVSLDNGSGVNTNLDVYLSYNDKRKLFELRPYCQIEQDSLCDILTERQIRNLQDGKIHFSVSKTELSEKAHKIY